MSVRASIAMAVYNGEKYIREQIDSIILLMADNDEIIISYDKSSDKTFDIIKQYEAQDERIHVFINDKPGLGNNFQNAVSHCKGEYILYSDQDDVWINDKINKSISFLISENVGLIVHDGWEIDKNLDIKYGTVFNGKKMTKKPFKIWVKTRGKALGCCMCFKSQYIDNLLPFPNDDHDVWTINIISRLGGVAYLDEKCILHRIHGGNVSVPYRRNMLVVILSRIELMRSIRERIRNAF